MRENDVGFQADKLRRKGAHSLDVAARPTDCESDVASFNPSKCSKTIAKCGEPLLCSRLLFGRPEKYADEPDFLALLSACSKRPCRNSNCLDEIAPSHVPCVRITPCAMAKA
jgi:hypothetical protein